MIILLDVSKESPECRQILFLTGKFWLNGFLKVRFLLAGFAVAWHNCGYKYVNNGENHTEPLLGVLGCMQWIITDYTIFQHVSSPIIIFVKCSRE